MAVMMKALVIEEYGNLSSLHLKDVQVPTPRSHQVLIRVHYAPLNPADLEFINGTHSHKRPLPAIPGFEGSGTVIKSGGGFKSWNLVNKKVAFKQEDTGLDGSWAEYIVVDVKMVTVIKEEVPLEQAACFYVNALTVMMFIDVIESQKHKAIIQNAAACSIGKMLLRWCNYHDIQVINIIRREEQANQLRDLAADIILNSESENFKTELRILSQRYEVSAAFDCIGGSLAGLMLESLCDYGVLYVHGKISKQPISGISPSSFIFKGKKIEGLWVRPWFHGLSRMKRISVMQKIQNLNFIFRTDIVGVYNIDQFKEAIKLFPSTRSSGKLLFKLKPEEPIPRRNVPYQETGLWKYTELSPQDAETLIEKYKTPEFKQASENLGWLDIRPINQESLIYRSSRLLDDGRIYDGQWHKDVSPHGAGVMYYPDGSRFEGLWKEGRKQKGRLITQKGEIYNGNWDIDCLQGSGSLLTPEMNYEGEWKHGQFHGIGTLTYTNESKYTGSFIKGKRCGKGHWTSNTGEDYQGMFENNEMHGEGIYRCNSYEYKGTFEHGVMKGQGSISFRDGRVFNGELSDELEGEGILVYMNQDEYQGTIAKGEPEGKGSYNAVNGTVRRGTWKNGKLVSEEESEVKSEMHEGNEVYIEDEAEPKILKIDRPTQSESKEEIKDNSEKKVEVVELEPEDQVEVVHAKHQHTAEIVYHKPVHDEPEHQVQVVHAEPESQYEQNNQVEVVYQKPVHTQSQHQHRVEVFIPEEEEQIEVVYQKYENKSSQPIIQAEPEVQIEVIKQEQPEDQIEIIQAKPEDHIEVIQAKSESKALVIQAKPESEALVIQQEHPEDQIKVIQVEPEDQIEVIQQEQEQPKPRIQQEEQKKPAISSSKLGPKSSKAKPTQAEVKKPSLASKSQKASSFSSEESQSSVSPVDGSESNSIVGSSSKS